eukprot:TRINITY_DN16395_c0_g1_i2.p1 TRINITY_DN16395_c0_g1~~TRINITY_DN16395_c0_g1_i2.p1  ORF type:complete len:552 (+),score=130.23 TRINITY_DN16395_c0_g1_i2:36-1691(+)
MKQWLVLAAICVFFVQQLWLRTETRQLAMGGSLDGNSYEENAPLATVDAIFESRHKELDAATSAKLRRISIGGLCSTHSDCRSCLADKLCTWCAQIPAATKHTVANEETQACIAKDAPCHDPESAACSTALLTHPEVQICPVEEQILTDTINYWGYSVSPSNCQVLINECSMLQYSEDDDCDPLSMALRSVPSSFGSHTDRKQKILCESNKIYNTVREAGRQSETSLVQDLKTWKAAVHEATICVVDVDHGDEYAQEALRGGCYVVAYTSDASYSPTFDIPSNFILHSASPQEVVSFVENMLDKPEVIASYKKYLAAAQDLALITYRRKVRRYLSNSVHVVTFFADKADLKYFLSFVLVTLLQMHMASIELFICSGLEEQLQEEYKQALTYLGRYSITKRLVITSIKCPTTVPLTRQLAFPDGARRPVFVALIPNPSTLVLTRDMLNILATQLSLSNARSINVDGVAFTSLVAYESGVLQGDINKTLPGLPDLYYKKRNPKLQLAVQYPHVEQSLDVLYQFMETRNYFCQHSFYNVAVFQEGLPKLLRCTS